MIAAVALTTLVSSLLLGSQVSAQCFAVGLPSTIKAGDSFKINQASNGLDDGSITAQVISGSVEIVDQCSFSATFTFTFNAANDSAPEFRWYGNDDAGRVFPIVDEAFVGNLTQEEGARAQGSFSVTNETYSLTSRGEFIGGVDFSMFNTITIYSETYKWLIASVNLPRAGRNNVGSGSGSGAGAGSGSGSGSGSGNTAETSGALSTTVYSALVFVFAFFL
ncbi:MAG: hypothetical protein SGCHY_003115 [Lobulomycetales sp.]